MASSGANTNLSQFFISYGPLPSVEGQFTIFGHLIDGDQTLSLLESLPVKGKGSKPIQDILIKEVSILANPIADQEWEERS